jgi:hypothetical protein
MTNTRVRMTKEQLDCFLVANGLHAEPDGALLAPKGEKVGAVTLVDGGAFRILVSEEGYRQGEDEVKVWWPEFRPAWVLVAPDGEIEVGDTLGPDEVICDVCNAEVMIRPVPVVNGYARCRRCFGDLDLPFPGHIKPYEPAEAAETDECGGQVQDTDSGTFLAWRTQSG